MKNMFKYASICGILIFLLCISFILPSPLVSFKNSVVHLSFDDVEYCLNDLTNNDEYKCLYDQPFFAYIKRLHDKYDVDITLYTYANGSNGWNIEQMPNRYKRDFSEASAWLKIGFHASSPEITKDSIAVLENFMSDYNRVTNSICSFACKENIATTLRLHYFFASLEEVKFLKMEGGVKSLLSSDDIRISYSLDTASNEKLICEEFLNMNGIYYRKTDIRVENSLFPNVSLIQNSRENDIVIFTHEWALNKLCKIKLEYILWRICKGD